MMDELRETTELVAKVTGEEPSEDMEKEILRAAYVPNGEAAGDVLRKMMKRLRENDDDS